MLKQGVTAGRIFPVTCGVATRNLGTDRLLEALVEDLPSPAMRGAAARRSAPTARRSRSSPTRTGRWSPTSSRRSPTPTPAGSTSSASTAARSRSDSQAVNVSRRQKERIGQLGQPLGKELRPATELGAGDIGAVAKLKETRAGDVLCDGQEEVAFAPLDLPDPVMAFAYEPKSKGDEEKAAAAVRRLTEEDPTLDVHRDAQTGEQIIAGLTQIHVEVIVARMKRRFGVEIELHPPRVPYQESIRQPAERPRPLQEAVGRARPVRRLPDRDRAGRGRRRARVRQPDQGRRDPRRLHPGGREGGRRGDGARHRRRLPGQGRAGAARRRQAPRRRLLGDGLQDRRRDGLQGGDGGGRPGPARADRAAHGQLPGGRRRRRDRRPQLAPRPSAGDGAEGLDDRGQGRGADGRGARLRARPALDQRRPRRLRRWSSTATKRSRRTSPRRSSLQRRARRGAGRSC